MADTTRTIGDVLADLNSIRKGKMPDGSTAADRAKKKKKAPLMGDLDATEVQHKPDVNLPDEKKGKAIGILGHTEEKTGATVGRTVSGGDDDDPRWAEHNERKRYVGKRSYKAATLGGLTGGK